MARFKVDYQGGESRMNAGLAVDYMLAVAEVDGEEVELYAEEENPTWDEEKEEYADEAATYESLKEEILAQANAAEISKEDLEFMYD